MGYSNTVHHNFSAFKMSKFAEKRSDDKKLVIWAKNGNFHVNFFFLTNKSKFSRFGILPSGFFRTVKKCLYLDFLSIYFFKIHEFPFFAFSVGLKPCKKGLWRNLVFNRSIWSTGRYLKVRKVFRATYAITLY